MHCHLLFLFRDLHYCLVLLFNGYHVCLWVCEHKWVFSVQPAVYKLLAAGTICSFLRNIQRIFHYIKGAQQICTHYMHVTINNSKFLENRAPLLSLPLQIKTTTSNNIAIFELVSSELKTTTLMLFGLFGFENNQ